MHSEVKLRQSGLSSDIIPENKEEPVKAQFKSLFQFSDMLDSLLMLLGIIGSLFMGVTITLYAILIGDLVDSLNTGINTYEQAKQTMILLVYLGIACLLVGMGTSAAWNISAARQASRCRKQYFKSVLRQEIGWFDINNQTQITLGFSNDTLTFEQAIGEKISILAYIIGMLLSAMVFALYLGWIFALIILGYMPFLLMAWGRNVRVRQRIFSEQKQVYDSSDKKARQTFSAIKLVKQMNAEQFQTEIQNKILSEEVQDKYNSLGKQFAYVVFFAYVALNLLFTIGFWYGSQCVFGSKLCSQSISTRPYTAGLVLKIIYALANPIISLNQLTPSIQKIGAGLFAMTRINGILDREPAIKSKQNAVVPEKFEGVFVFESVTFAYPKNKNVKILQNFDLKIDSRHTVIIGKSGKGKSTIFQLIMRYYDPDEGNVYLDGVNLKDLSLEWLRSQIGYVGQEPVLFATSIKENLLLAKSDATENDIESALKKAEAYNFVCQLPDQLNTFVGSEGGQLSGGQKQRIAIARALLKQPHLLLLDEATSALDSINQGQILKTMKQVEEEYQTITITHRRKVLQNADKIYELRQDGTVSSIPRIEKQVNYLVKNNKNPGQINKQLIMDKNKSQNINKLFVQKAQEPLFQKQNSSGKGVMRLCSFLMNDKCLFFVCMLFSALDAIIFPTTGALFGHLTAYMLKYSSDPSYYESQLYKIVYIMIGVSFAGGITQSVAIWSGAKLSQHVVRKLRIDLFAKLVKLPLSWYNREENQHEKVISKVTESCLVVHSFLSLELQLTIIIILNILYAITAALYFDWRTGLSTIVLTPLILLSQIIHLGFVQGFSQEKSKYYGQASQVFSESVMNIRTVLSLDAVKESSDRYQYKMDTIIGILTRKSFISGFMFGLSYLMMFVSFGLTFFISVIFQESYSIKSQNSFSAIFLIFFACLSAGSKSNSIQNISNLKESANLIFSYLDLDDQQEILNKQGSKQLTSQIKGNIEFQNVWFKYHNRDYYALEDFNLSIKQGQQAVLVGSSGCGKSTVISLLQGLYFPEKGTILIEGIDIRDYSLQHLRNCFGIVSQEPALFNESVEWNIRYNMVEAEKKDIYEAAHKANYIDRIPIQNTNELSHSAEILYSQEALKDEFKESISNKFERKVGPKGCHVSGGQKQRIAIARAILRKPTILLLDEATSALDPLNQEAIQNVLTNLMKNKTIVNVTHKMESLKGKSKIVVVDHGKIVERGDYETLLQRKGLFNKMVFHQEIALQ